MMDPLIPNLRIQSDDDVPPPAVVAAEAEAGPATDRSPLFTLYKTMLPWILLRVLVRGIGYACVLM